MSSGSDEKLGSEKRLIAFTVVTFLSILLIQQALDWLGLTPPPAKPAAAVAQTKKDQEKEKEKEEGRGRARSPTTRSSTPGRTRREKGRSPRSRRPDRRDGRPRS